MPAEDEQQTREAGGSFTLALAAIAAAAVAVIMAAAALWAGHPAGTSPAQPAAATVVPNGKTQSFSIELGDMFVRPSSISVPYGTRVVLHVANDGAMRHDLQLEGGSTDTGMLAPGARATVDYGVFGSAQQAWCTVPGHKAAGMVLTIKVTGGPLAGTSASASMFMPGSSGATASSSATQPDATINPSATPAAGWQPFNASLAGASVTTAHHVTLIAEDREIQVASGVTQDMWTFNGQVPAPVLRGHVGDEWVVTLVNYTDMAHSLDFHAASQPMADMPEVAPGKSVTMTFRTMYSGIYLYHCGTPPVLEHLANGMFGAMIIDPPHLAPVAREFVVVQSDDSAFHVAGAQFTTVFNNGAYLLQPGNPATRPAVPPRPST